MKKAILIIGYITALLIMLGLLFKINHWPGGTLFVFAGMLFLSAVLVPIYFVNLIRNSTNRLERVSYVFGLLSLSFIVLAQMFKMLHWPGGSIMIILSTLTFSLIALPLYIIVKLKDEDKKLKDVFIIIVMAASFTFFVVNYERQPSMPDFYSYSEIESTIQFSLDNLEKTNYTLFARLKEKYSADEIKLSRIKVLRTSSQQLNEYIESLKTEMIQMSDGPNSPGLQNHSLIQQKDNSSIPSFIMVSNNPSNQLVLNDYLNQYNKLLNSFEEEFLQVHTCQFESIKQNMHDLIVNNYFQHTPLIEAITFLTGMQLEVQSVENCILTKMANP